MSKLVLTRKPGQSIRLELKPNLFLVMTCQSLSYNHGLSLHLECMGAEEVQRVRVLHSAEIAPGVKVLVSSVKQGIVRLVFDAPTDVKILRSELVEVARA